MAITPRLAIVIRPEPAGAVQIDAAETQRWNQLTWRCATRFLITERGVDWRQATLAPPTP